MAATKIIDSKGRLLLGNEFAGSTYLMEKNIDGIITLRPAITVPVKEAWLYQNKKAIESVQQGLNEAKSGKVKSIEWKSDAQTLEKLDDGK